MFPGSNAPHALLLEAMEKAIQAIEFEYRMIQRGEILLTIGLAGLAGSVVLFSFVMIGLMAIPIFPVALLVVIAGLIRARTGNASVIRQTIGFLSLIFALVALVWASTLMVDMAGQYFLYAQRGDGPLPSMKNWLFSILVCLCSSFLAGIGLRCWAHWSRLRCSIWSVILLLMPPATFAIYRSLASWLPIEA